MSHYIPLDKSMESASGNRVRQSYYLIERIEQDTSEKIISSVKQSKLKVQVKKYKVISLGFQGKRKIVFMKLFR